MTAKNALIRKVTPISAFRGYKGTINAPARPASAAPKAKVAEYTRLTATPEARPARLEKVALALPPVEVGTATVLGTGAEAAPKVVEILKEIGVLA